MFVFMQYQDPIEVLFSDKVQNIFDSFCSCFDIRIIFLTLDGRIVRSGMNRKDSHFCRLIQQTDHGVSKCQKDVRKYQQEAFKTGQMVSYKCHAGLHEAIVPVSVNKQPIGFVMIGQFRTNEKKSFFDNEEMQKAYFSLPCYLPEKIKDIHSFLGFLVDYIISTNLVGLRGNLTVNQIILFIRNNLKTQITLSSAAAKVNLSPFTVSRLFKRHTGLNFKRFIINLKLEKAEELLLNGNMTVANVSAWLGFADPFCFSRIFKKYKKMSPSNFQKQKSESGTLNKLISRKK